MLCFCVCVCVLEEFTVGIARIVDACLDEIVALASDLKLLEFQLSNGFVSPYIISNLAASHSAVGNFSIILKQIFTKRFKHAIPKIFHYMRSRFFPSPSSLSCFCPSALFIISVSLPFPFSLLLRTDFPMCCRCGYAPIQEGIAEKTSLVTVVSLAMFLTSFYNWRF